MKQIQSLLLIILMGLTYKTSCTLYYPQYCELISHKIDKRFQDVESNTIMHELKFKCGENFIKEFDGMMTEVIELKKDSTHHIYSKCK